MTKRLFSLAALTACLFSVQSAQATITFTFTGGFFSDMNGVNTAAGTLFQLVALGNDGIFNEINVGDGTVNSLDRWVSGDDTVISAGFTGDPQFSTLAAFDHQVGADENGSFERQFITSIPAGTKIGIRWFPGLQASQFNSITLQAGQKYGQFTRQNDPLATGPLYDGVVHQGGNLWIAPQDGLPNVAFDPLITLSAGGTESNALGMATLEVVPEPAALTLAALGAIGLFGFRRRRS